MGARLLTYVGNALGLVKRISLCDAGLLPVLLGLAACESTSPYYSPYGSYSPSAYNQNQYYEQGGTQQYTPRRWPLIDPEDYSLPLSRYQRRQSTLQFPFDKQPGEFRLDGENPHTDRQELLLRPGRHTASFSFIDDIDRKLQPGSCRNYYDPNSGYNCRQCDNTEQFVTQDINCRVDFVSQPNHHYLAYVSKDAGYQLNVYDLTRRTKLTGRFCQEGRRSTYYEPRVAQSACYPANQYYNNGYGGGYYPGYPSSGYYPGYSGGVYGGIGGGIIGGYYSDDYNRGGYYRRYDQRYRGNTAPYPNNSVTHPRNNPPAQTYNSQEPAQPLHEGSRRLFPTSPQPEPAQPTLPRTDPLLAPNRVEAPQPMTQIPSGISNPTLIPTVPSSDITMPTPQTPPALANPGLIPSVPSSSIAMPAAPSIPSAPAQIAQPAAPPPAPAIAAPAMPAPLQSLDKRARANIPNIGGEAAQPQ